MTTKLLGSAGGRCQLCGKDDRKEEIEHWVGGGIAYMHPSCAKIGGRAIDGYIKHLRFMRGVKNATLERIPQPKPANGLITKEGKG